MFFSLGKKETMEACFSAQLTLKHIVRNLFHNVFFHSVSGFISVLCSQYDKWKCIKMLGKYIHQSFSRRYYVGILLIRRKTLSNQSILLQLILRSPRVSPLLYTLLWTVQTGGQLEASDRTMSCMETFWGVRIKKVWETQKGKRCTHPTSKVNI